MVFPQTIDVFDVVAPGDWVTSERYNALASSIIATQTKIGINGTIDNSSIDGRITNQEAAHTTLLSRFFSDLSTGTGFDAIPQGIHIITSIQDVSVNPPLNINSQWLVLTARVVNTNTACQVAFSFHSPGVAMTRSAVPATAHHWGEWTPLFAQWFTGV